MIRPTLAGLLLAGMLLAAAPAAAAPTEVVVRVLSQGAKFIGDGVGGVEVTLADAGGRTLATGRIAGGTGDTARIMAGAPRGTPVAGPGAAAFRATLDIAVPTLVTATVRGPLGHPAAAVTATIQRWLLPGQVVTGDGWVVELPGLVVRGGVADGVIGGDVMMLCGCPIEAGGLWDAARFEVTATLANGTRLPLSFTGRTGHFAAPLPGRTGGSGAIVTALDRLTGATGIGRIAE